MPARPPEVVSCSDCTPGHRCEEHKRPLVTGFQNARLFCPACGAELNRPNHPQVPGCRPSCPQYGRRVRVPRPPPFAPAPIPAPKSAKKGFGESGHDFHDAAPMLARVRAWERLERACDAWAQHRDQAERGPTSPLSLLKIENEIEDTTRELRALREGNRR